MSVATKSRRYCLRFFFFSSRRRHTRLQGDWSSDVCSSDLISGHGCDDSIRRDLPNSLIAGIITGNRNKQIAKDVHGHSTRIGQRGASGGVPRSGEGGGGEEGRSRWGPDHLKKKKR